MPNVYILIKSSDSCNKEPMAFETREEAIRHISKELHKGNRGVYLFRSTDIIVDNINDTIDEYNLFLLIPDTLTIHAIFPTEEECAFLGVKNE